MKKIKTKRIVVLMLALTLLTCCFVGSTFARYTSTSTGTDSATVAKWAFTLGSDDIVASDTFTFDLFQAGKVNDLDGSGNVDANDDADIVNERSGAVLIAPGCGGTVSVLLTNNSEVNATYAVDFTADEAGVPLEWSADNTTWTTDPTDITATAIGNGDSVTITLYYRWAFDSTVVDGWNNAKDTALGAAGTATPSITAVVTVEQVD